MVKFRKKTLEKEFVCQDILVIASLLCYICQCDFVRNEFKALFSFYVRLSSRRSLADDFGDSIS